MKVVVTVDSTGNKGQGETDATRFRASSDVVYNRVGDQGMLVHMQTNQIYELNHTGARFWELLSAGHDRVEIQRIMLQEFDVTEADVAAEIDTMIASLTKEGLITSYNGD